MSTCYNNEEDGGVYFDPDDQELIKDHLLPKLRSYLQPKSKDGEDFIGMKDVYEKEPWLLEHTNNPLFKKNEWFYFVTRTQVAVKNMGRGKNSKRRIIGENDGWSWKPNAKKNIIDEATKEIIGKKQTLKFTQSNNKKKKQKRGDGGAVVVPGSNSSWIMYEYSLPDQDKFHELVLCKIRKKNNSKDDHEDSDQSIQAAQQLVCYHGEGNMVHQIDTSSMMEIEMVPSEQQVEAMEVTNNVEDGQQQAPIYASTSQTSAPPARLDDKSPPIEVDDEDEDDDDLWNQELNKYLPR